MKKGMFLTVADSNNYNTKKKKNSRKDLLLCFTKVSKQVQLNNWLLSIDLPKM